MMYVSACLMGESLLVYIFSRTFLDIYRSKNHKYVILDCDVFSDYKNNWMMLLNMALVRGIFGNLRQ